MHKFYFTCRCIRPSAVYGTEEGKQYFGEGHVNEDGSVEYVVKLGKHPYGPQIYKSEWFGEYFRIVYAS